MSSRRFVNIEGGREESCLICTQIQVPSPLSFSVSDQTTYIYYIIVGDFLFSTERAFLPRKNSKEKSRPPPPLPFPPHNSKKETQTYMYGMYCTSTVCTYLKKRRKRKKKTTRYYSHNNP